MINFTKEDAILAREILNKLYELCSGDIDKAKYISCSTLKSEIDSKVAISEFNSSLGYISTLLLIDLIYSADSSPLELKISDMGISFIRDKKNFLEFQV